MMAKSFYSKSYAKEDLKSRYTNISMIIYSNIFNNIKHLLALDIAKFISEP